MKKLLPLLGAIWIVLGPTKILAQELVIPEDQKEFLSFLQIQQQVPGLGYRLLVPDFQKDSLFWSELGIKFSLSDSGQVSEMQENFDLVKSLPEDSLAYQLFFTVFSDVTSEEGAREYISNLVRNGDYRPRSGLEKPREDLVAMAIKSPYMPVFSNRYSFTADVKLFIVVGVILLFFVFAASMFTFLLILKAKRNRREELKKEYDQKIVDPLTSLLFEKSLEEIQAMRKGDFEVYFPKSFIAKPIYRDVLIERIIGLNKKMKGEFKDKLKVLYHKLELEKVTLRKIKQSKWHIVADGLVEVNEMDLVEYISEVKNLTNSSNFHVRSLAVAAMLNLSEKSDLSFLRDQTFPLSEWQQMNYLRIIKFVSQQKDLKIEMLFDSSNPSIRIFGLKLVRMLGRVDLLEKLSQIESSLGDEEKIEILNIYREFGAHMKVDFVNACLKSTNLSLLTEAIKTSQVVGNAVSIEILQNLISGEYDFQIKLLILKSIFDLNESKFHEITLETMDNDLFRIRKHILDPKLAHV
jgi:hypothetical protein